MARIPGPESISGPASMRGGGPMAAVDTSGLERGRAQFAAGLGDLSQGLNSLSGSLSQVAQQEKQRQNVSDIAKAEALWTTGSLDMGDRAETDGDWRTYDKRYGGESVKLKEAAGALIRDEETRTRFLDQLELRRIATVNSINDRARELSHEEDRVSFDAALGDSAALISDPTVGPVVREKARADVQGSIEMGVQSGLFRPSEGARLREKYLDGANHDLSLNRLNLDLEARPEYVRDGSGIASAMGGNDVATAAMAASGGAVPLELGVAEMAADVLGDKNFPRGDAKLADAYLLDPEVNAKYTAAAMDLLTERFKGDLTAAVIASAPDGGTELADKWVKSKHNENVLPPSVKKYYRDVMGRIAPERDMTPMPIIAEPGVDLTGVDVAVLDRFEKVQTAFGGQFKILSGFRDPAHNAEVGGATKSQHMERRALDIDVSKLPEAERIRLIETASAMGFTGIGVYGNSLHLDTGSRRAWGPDHSGKSVPAWAKDVIGRHTAGDITEAMPGVANVAPEYQDLTFDERLRGYQAANQRLEQRNVDAQANIAVAVQNAPAAIIQSGAYGGTIPDANDFVKAYGAADGIERYRQFEASIQVAEAGYGMQTMSGDDIASMVESYTPTANPQSAALEAKRFDTISTAASQILAARDKDPGGYTMNAFPNVKAAWEAVSDGSGTMENALNVTATAQEKLGIENPELLPAEMATNVVGTFNNTELSQPERMGAITYAVFGTQNEDQQAMIAEQLIKAGLPPQTRGAFAALERGDEAGSSYLFRAAMTEVKDSMLPKDTSTALINDKIAATILDENQVGDVIYGLTGGTAENMARATEDMTLFQNAVKLRLIDGSAGGDIATAVRLTQKDMYGDVRVVTGKPWDGGAGVKIVLPAKADAEPYRKGFNALMPTVENALIASLTLDIAGADTSDMKLLTMARDNYVSTALESGYFTNSDKGFVFINAQAGAAVNGPDGQPLVFSESDVTEAGLTVDASNASISQQYRDMTAQGMFPEPPR